MYLIARILLALVSILGIMMSLHDMLWWAQWGTWENTFLEMIARMEEISAAMAGREFSGFRVWIIWQGVYFCFLAAAVFMPTSRVRR